MSSIGEQLRATLLSLKQLSDRVKSLITTSVTKSEATADKNEILAAIGNIPAPDMSAIAKQGSNANATLTDTQAQATAAATAAQAITGYALQGSDSTKTNTQLSSEISGITSSLIAALEERYDFPVSYDGVVSSTPIESVLGAIVNKAGITAIDDSNIAALPNMWTTYGISNCTKLRLRNCTSLANQCFAGSSLTELSVDIYSANQYQVFRAVDNLKRLYAPLLARTDVGTALFLGDANLIDIEAGSTWDGDVTTFLGGPNSSYSSYAWNPTNALSSSSSSLVTDTEDEDGNPIESNLDQLLYNIRRHIAANMQTTTSGWTIYFGPDVKSAILADTRTTAAFTDKGWTIA